MGEEDSHMAFSAASRNQRMFDTFPSGIVVQDADGKITSANPAAQAILGLTQDQMLGVTSMDPGWQAVHEDGSPFPGETHPAMQCLRTGVPVRDVVMGVFHPRLGQHRWIEVNAVPLHEPSEHRLTGVYSTFQDISGRMALQVQSQQSLAALHASEDAIVACNVDGAVTRWNAKAQSLFGYAAADMVGQASRQMRTERALRDKDAEFRIAVQTSSDGFWIADMQGRLLDVNDAYVGLSGYSREELLTLSIPDLDFSDSEREVGERIGRIVRNGSERFLTAHRGKGGRRWPAEVVASYAPVAGGRFFCFIKDLTEQQTHAELVWHQANFDRLTDLPNRALFFDRLSQECSAARRKGKSVALLFADLDAFKAVNDHFGHDAGDVVLRTVATRWLACVRATDTVARLGGDEFALILGDLDGPHEAAAVAQKLIDAASKSIPLPENHQCTIGASVGIAMYPANAWEMDSLLAAADQAMYVCKQRGKNVFAISDAVVQGAVEQSNWVAFTDAHLVGVADIDDQHRELVRMVNEINHAIASGSSPDTIASGFEKLIAYTLLHFQTEHHFMVNHHYPDTKAHDQEHAQLVTELRMLAQKKANEGDMLVLQKIKDWLINHIQNTDKPMGRYLNTLGVH